MKTPPLDEQRLKCGTPLRQQLQVQPRRHSDLYWGSLRHFACNPTEARATVQIGMPASSACSNRVGLTPSSAAWELSGKRQTAP